MTLKRREASILSGVVLVLLVGWLGFLLHRSPRFPGSALGSAFGIAGAALMLVPLLHVVVKRVQFLRQRLARRVSLSASLAWHVYMGLLGPLLALVHTAHRFDSAVGIALTAAMLLVVVSGFVGRTLHARLNRELHESRSMLVQLHIELSRGAPAGRLLDLAGAVADVELAVRTRELLQRSFTRWLTVHIVLSVAMYLLLALHIGAGVHYGLRWLR